MDLTAIVANLRAKATEAANSTRLLPESTYRLQFHKGFTFHDALGIVHYLRDLGITHCYASPYLKASPGSTHGYDIVDHGCLNPEIGTPDEYEAWVAALRKWTGTNPRCRPQSHGRGHERQRVVERRTRERRVIALWYVFRHRLAGVAPRGAQGQDPLARARRALWRRARIWADAARF